MTKLKKLHREIVIIEAPSNLGLMPLKPDTEPGTRKGPEALKQLGLLEAVPHIKTMCIDAPKFRDDADNPTGIRQAEAIDSYSRVLADAVEQVIGAGGFPLVIGGDCSILLGSLLGAKRKRETPLLFVDGHTDFYLPSQSGTGGAAGMDLALVTGWGPDILTNIDGCRPYVKLEQVAVIGNRDLEQRANADIPDLANSQAYYKTLCDTRNFGIENTIAEAIEHIGGNVHPYWIHLDIDAIDNAIMPAVDSPQEDGFSEAEILILLAKSLSSNPAGMQITIYDPDKDPEREAGKTLVRILRKLFSKG